MAQNRPAPLDFTMEPPNPPFANGNGNGSPNTSDSEPPSPPVSPRSLSFLVPPAPRDSPSSNNPNFNSASSTSRDLTSRDSATALPNPFAGGGSAPGTPYANPFSPPASVRSFSASFSTPTGTGAGSPLDTPGHGHGHNPNASSIGSTGYPFPSAYAGTPGSTRASSVVDMPRAFSTYSFGGGARDSFSRPGTGGSSAGAGSGLRPLAQNGGSTGGAGENPKGKREAFASPPARPLTIYAAPSTARLRRERPKSTAILVPSSTMAEVDEKGKPLKPKLAKDTRPLLKTVLSKPWVGQRDPHSRWAYWITYLTICLGLGAGAVQIYFSWKSVLLLQGNLCPVLLEDFANTSTAQLFGSGVAGEGGTFFREVDASGFGNGEFEMTTASDANSFVQNGQLFLVPTLTSDVIPAGSILDGAVYNLTGCTYNITHSSGYTTSGGHGAAGINTTQGEGGGGDIAPDAPLDLPAYLAACSAVSNATTGQILPPVMSARISTRKSASLKFGRVEVVAKLPTGDWLWPAIWMLPVDNAYGGWPLSGEIDIMEARGNGPNYPKQGINYVRSSLNWGPATFLNAVAKTYGWVTQRRGRYDDGFHTYALEWSDGFMRMYVDSRLKSMYQLKFKESFWERGDFPTVVQNGTESVVLENPWVNGTNAAPFDQAFYLIMNVAVGGTNGWFPDGPEKPWLDGSGTAPLDFLRAQDQWYSTWPQDTYGRAMVIDSVKMWESC